MKFKAGDRVRLLNKSAGVEQGLEKLLEIRYRGTLDPPKTGIVKSIQIGHDRWGDIVLVKVDGYDNELHTYEQFVFKESDLEKIDNSWGLSEELFEF